MFDRVRLYRTSDLHIFNVFFFFTDLDFEQYDVNFSIKCLLRLKSDATINPISKMQYTLSINKVML